MAKLYHFVTARQSPAVGAGLKGDCGHPFTVVALSRLLPPLSNRCPGCNTMRDDPVRIGEEVFYLAEEVDLLPGETRNPMGLLSRMLADAQVRIAKPDPEVPTTQTEVIEKARAIRQAKELEPPSGGKILHLPVRRKSGDEN